MTDTTATTDTAGFTLAWHFDAARERVFRAWTDPAQLGWFFNDEQAVPPEPIEVDLRVGGAWRQMMVYTPDDRKYAGGVYREIVPDEVLEFVFGAVGGWPDLDGDGLDTAPIVRLEFADAADGGTDLTLRTWIRQEGDEQSLRELLAAMRAGWTQTVARLGVTLEG
jgi:uncharacterized protein YndB with AHSA1/START domain